VRAGAAFLPSGFLRGVRQYLIVTWQCAVARRAVAP
jgi:hypothetical protein